VARVQNIEKILDLVEELFDELENTDVQDLFESLPDMEQDEVVVTRKIITQGADRTKSPKLATSPAGIGGLSD